MNVRAHRCGLAGYQRLLALLVLALAVALVSGCAVVTASSVSPSAYLAERRGDVLTTGRLSDNGREVLRIVGIDDCREAPVACREQLRSAPGLTQEQRLSALSELWLEAALALDQQSPGDPATAATAATVGTATTAATANLALETWIEAARQSWAYLFFTERQPQQRAFEERQTQVRDYYNYAVQRTAELLFHDYTAENAKAPRDEWEIGKWHLRVHAQEVTRETRRELPRALIAASTLRFTGLRNTYRRGGFGATFVAELGPPGPQAEGDATPFAESRYPVGTAMLAFAGTNLQELLATRDVEIFLFDPYRYSDVTVAGQNVPLAANFTAGYGLWLANSGFATQALRSLLGMNSGIVRPRIDLMQPYDPDRGVVLMLHGLASSPEAWVNVANEVMGDEALRRNYQIWQVYYPTNAPLPLNLYTIRQAIEQTFEHFDPSGQAMASRDVVIVGHSMGGVLARLLVSNSGDQIWKRLPPQFQEAAADDPQVRQSLARYIDFQALPQVERAVFIASPHRGTPFAASGLGRFASALVKLPEALTDQISGVTRSLEKAESAKGESQPVPVQLFNSIDTLSENNPIIQATADLPIDPRIPYHSIIARESANGPLEDSSDGVVPYASSHLAGAQSELIVPSTHSVQENPKAILELRRILHLDLSKRRFP